MVTSADAPAGDRRLDVWADPAKERVATPATIITAIRTVAAVVLAGVAAGEQSLGLLLVALGVYWAGDSLDGQVARRLHCETRIGAVLDILSDRLCASAFYIGLMWLHPEFAPAILIYLAEFMVLDCFLSLAFLAWPLRSPNYFYVVDHRLWLFNWSHPGKAVNSAAFALLLLLTGWVAVGVVVALALLAFKTASVLRLGRLGLPVPER